MEQWSELETSQMSVLHENSSKATGMNGNLIINSCFFVVFENDVVVELLLFLDISKVKTTNLNQRFIVALFTPHGETYSFLKYSAQQN